VNIFSSYKNYLLSFFAFIVFFPTYLFGSTSTGQAYLFLFFPIILLITYLFLAFLNHNQYKGFKVPFLGVVLFIYGVLILVTSLSKLSFIDFSLFINHFRYFSYALILCLAYNISNLLIGKCEELNSTLFTIFFFVVAFIFLQLLFPDNSLINLITKRKLSDYLGFRVGGPFDWSYVFAFCSIPVVFSFLHGLVRGENNIALTFVGYLVFFAFFLTQSKAAYISFVLLVVIWTVFSFFNYKRNRKLLFYLSFLIFLIVVGIIFNPDMFLHFSNFYNALASGGVDASTNTRLNQFEVLDVTLESNFLLGYPLKYVIIENSYVHYFYNYGLIGVVFFVVTKLIFLIDSFIKIVQINKVNSGINLGLYIGISCMVFSVFIFGLGSSPTDANKSSYFFYFLYGNFISVAKNGMWNYNVR
jgi:hypothetical protein